MTTPTETFKQAETFCIQNPVGYVVYTFSCFNVFLFYTEVLA